MSETEAERELRAQLGALVADRPAAFSPAPLVIARVRRSRRRRAVAGALVAVAAVAGGTLVGLDRDRGAAPVEPAKPAPVCRVQLPEAWATALVGSTGRLPTGSSLIAASPNASQVFVQQGDRIVRLTDHLATQTTVMTLPALPTGLAASAWTVTGSFDGQWLVLALKPDDPKYLDTLGLYAWNADTGASRTLLAAVARPTRQIGSWVAGSGRAGWEEEPFRLDGGVANGTVKSRLADLSTGAVGDPGGSVRAFVGDTMLLLDSGNKPRTVALSVSDPAPVPEALSAFLGTHGSWASMTGDGGAFAWGGGTTPVKGPGGKEVGQGPASWDVWWPGEPSVARVTAPKGSYVAGVSPFSTDYAIGTLVRNGAPLGGETSEILIDLRDRSYAPLTAAQDVVLEGSGGGADRVLDILALPRLPDC
ncbi:hypothetical protein [Streptacidiphilus cavernicola]|uniref:LigA protein n=1 Tax=Streptacidiphilus cavernicola TaxID=3342716 RepID=A0ABV6VQL3_9ACTN